MLFDPRPKSSRKELFDREKQLEVLDRSVGKPLILVLGIRRIGKSSLLLSFLEEWRGVYIDLRGVRNTADLYRKTSEGLTGSLTKLKDALKGVSGVKIAGIEVTLKWRGVDSISLPRLIEQLSKKETVVFILDEIQMLRPPLSYELKNTIAYAYDNVPNCTFVLSGSQIGLLKDFVGVNNPESPLFGRYYTEVHVERFTGEQSREFLEKGFGELKQRVDQSVIEKGVALFDGIPGWLVHYGMSHIERKNHDEILQIAVNTARNELLKLNQREKQVAKAIANGAESWSSVRRLVEEMSGEIIPRSTLTRTIRALEKLSIIQDYRFLDPVYQVAAKLL
ncbi:hypothetical protein B9Q03_02340 [Candidatus Marsarchaeota G2 archaeon OSP_D]|uniref:ATPase domain-containing protein n=6 Tax=Candidatus Marsarchaeota group 2 TaxID=2203771 RepID=A0A2R6CCZ3_9ARCH|nr:MAG: hypothetical protein B9Q03_02340 [Candidatus Marsarchaeota G2 archaeon OSP_D]PSN93414.1 MAG: hypothetical protein B9Q09_05925 [Candidatus Marsarchaeota G2 archaeon ECH_B_SAG-C16]PSN96502.1 MAG: hypothetical protein B9Q06_02295 [Candidatus Marsarchaeota G2 archaeon ECH_B_2]PSO01150.1 MAG: hypothetical protein B9Q07_01640 [Candidatus Marsarchaeota G2 archaeon ECH_B_3]PSO02964.1 MAG: hypothetical protein B9Q05_02625 [Candidatus Marsarchaeota G2 archaeon ECH_B_1]PSO08763.1 MAG: hypothetica